MGMWTIPGKKQSETKAFAEEHADALAARAQAIAERGLITPAILFFDMAKPFSWLGSQFLMMLSPTIGFGLWDQELKFWETLLQDSQRVEEFIKALETAAYRQKNES